MKVPAPLHLELARPRSHPVEVDKSVSVLRVTEMVHLLQEGAVVAMASGLRLARKHKQETLLEDGPVPITKENLTDTVRGNGAFVQKARGSAKYIGLSQSLPSRHNQGSWNCA
jgi:hypothetical protein